MIMRNRKLTGRETSKILIILYYTHTQKYLTIDIKYKILGNFRGIAQWLRHLLYKINDLSLISENHTKVEGENQLHKEFFWLPHTELALMYTFAHTQAYKEIHTHKHNTHTQSVHTHITHTAIPKHYAIIKFWKWRSKETINWNKYLLTQIGISRFLFNIVTMLLKRDSAQSISVMFLKAPLAILK